MARSLMPAALALALAAAAVGVVHAREGANVLQPVGGLTPVQSSAGSDYDRGYRDGLQNTPSRAKERDNRAYADGYRAGQEDRKKGVKPSTRPAVGAPRNVQQLVGRTSSTLEQDMRSLGYAKHGGVKAGGKGFTVWRGARGASDCLQVTTKDKKVSDVKPLPETECQ